MPSDEPQNRMAHKITFERLRQLIIAKENPPTLTNSARTAVAVIVSLLVARFRRRRDFTTRCPPVPAARNILGCDFSRDRDAINSR